MSSGPRRSASRASRDGAGTGGSMAGLVPGRYEPRESDDFDMDRFLRVRGEPQDVLVAEQGGPGADEGLVDCARDAKFLAIRFRDRPQRQPGGLLLQDVESAGADPPAQRRPGEEPQVRLVQDAPAVVAEQASGGPYPGVPVREVRDRQQHLAA